jgi:hypothetical protein
MSGDLSLFLSLSSSSLSIAFYHVSCMYLLPSRHTKYTFAAFLEWLKAHQATRAHFNSEGQILDGGARRDYFLFSSYDTRLPRQAVSM